MTEQRQIEEAAKIEGWTWEERLDCFIREDKSSPVGYDARFVCGSVNLPQIPNYLHNYNAVHRLIGRMTVFDADNYAFRLDSLNSGVGFSGVQENAARVQISCAQMLKLVLKTYGAWEGE